MDFDSGTSRDITRIVFQHDQPILGMVMSVRGDEIDSQRAYDEEITKSTDFFIDLIKKEAGIVGSAIVLLGGISALTNLGVLRASIAAIAAVVTIGIDIIIAHCPARAQRRLHELQANDSVALLFDQLAA